MKLSFDVIQTVKDIGMIKFQVIENQSTWVVVYKFAAFIKKSGVVFIGFYDKKWRFSKAC